MLLRFNIQYTRIFFLCGIVVVVCDCVHNKENSMMAVSKHSSSSFSSVYAQCSFVTGVDGSQQRCQIHLKLQKSQ